MEESIYEENICICSITEFRFSFVLWAHNEEEAEELERRVTQNERENEETRMRQDEERSSRRQQNRENAVKAMVGFLRRPLLLHSLLMIR